jgi:hypothetical protein
MWIGSLIFVLAAGLFSMCAKGTDVPCFTLFSPTHGLSHDSLFVLIKRGIDLI